VFYVHISVYLHIIVPCRPSHHTSFPAELPPEERSVPRSSAHFPVKNLFNLIPAPVSSTGGIIFMMSFL
jgi:hypothetical protein